MKESENLSPARKALRERIIRTAYASFTKKGIKAITMDDIANLLSISKRTLYEIFRDKETLQIALQAALTGHLVLATLHTNDAISGVARLLDMGVESFFIGSTICGFQAQRLVRKLCPHCRYEVEPPEKMLVQIKNLIPEDYHFYKSHGCNCNWRSVLRRQSVFHFRHYRCRNKLSRM